MEQITQLLGSEQFKGSKNQDFQIKINLEQNHNLFADNEYHKTIDVANQFNVERQKATNYVIYGKIDPLYDNWDNKGNLYSALTEVDVAFDTFRNSVGRNWVIQVAYPSDAEVFSGHKMTIQTIFNNNTIIIDSNHQNIIEVGDILNIYDEYNKRFTYRVLNINSGTTNEFITFEGILPQTLLGNSKSFITPKLTTFNRYFKIMTDIKDYHSYKSAFSTNIFGGQVYQFHFNKDINIEKDDNGNLIYDFLGNKISELYIAIVKTITNGYNKTTENNYTFGVSSDIKSEILNSNNSGNLMLSNTGDEFIPKYSLYKGDIYEYNNNDLTGRTIEKIYHKFLYLRPNNNCVFYYQPFYQMNLRKYSNALENGNTATTSNIPQHAMNVNNNGEMVWRDLLDIGYFEENINGVNYPFMNGRHYLYNDIKLYIRRVTPISSGTTNLDIFDYDQSVNVNSTGFCN